MAETPQSETFWVALRGILMMSGSVLATFGFLHKEDIAQFMPLLDQAHDAVMTAIPALWALGAFCWALYVRYQTKSVPLKTALRADVPTVNPATGKTVPGIAFTPDTHPKFAKVANKGD